MTVLEQFDNSKKAIFNPEDMIKPVEGFPKVVVSCFARATFDRLLEEVQGVEIAKTCVANMEIPIYRTNYKGHDIGLFMSYVGAAGCVAVAEDIIAMGAEKLIFFGTCGVLDASIADCSIIIPDKAVRDEGTSYHYVEAADEIEVNRKNKDTFIELLNELDCHYTVGKVWTTDGIYRETRKTAERRKEEGCICVEMECAALAALGQFRDKEIFEFFYAADNLDQEEWDARSLGNYEKLQEKDRIAAIAMEFASRIS